MTATLLDFFLPQDLAPLVLWIFYFKISAAISVVWRVQVVARTSVRAVCVTWAMFEALFLRLNTVFGALLSLAWWQQVTVVNALRLSCCTFTAAACSQVTPNLAANQLNITTPTGTWTSLRTVRVTWTLPFTDVFLGLTLLQTDAITITVNRTVKGLIVARFHTLVDIFGMIS